MAPNWWLGLVLGAGVGLAYALGGYVTTRYAARHGGRRFMALFFGGMIVRLAIALALVTLVLALTLVPALPFAGALLVTFVAGLAIDVIRIHRGGLDPPE